MCGHVNLHIIIVKPPYLNLQSPFVHPVNECKLFKKLLQTAKAYPTENYEGNFFGETLAPLGTVFLTLTSNITPL